MNLAFTLHSYCISVNSPEDCDLLFLHGTHLHTDGDREETCDQLIQSAVGTIKLSSTSLE